MLAFDQMYARLEPIKAGWPLFGLYQVDVICELVKIWNFACSYMPRLLSVHLKT
jgi:hypothetical protein